MDSVLPYILSPEECQCLVSYPLGNSLPVLRWHKFHMGHNLKVIGFGQVVTSTNIGF